MISLLKRTVRPYRAPKELNPHSLRSPWCASISALLESKIGRDPTKYILSNFLKNKNDLLNAILNRNVEWLNYFNNVKIIIIKDVPSLKPSPICGSPLRTSVSALNAIIDSGNTEYMKFYDGYNWNIGLGRACECGDMEFVELMIHKGANDWFNGLYSACKGGHMACVKLMIQKIVKIIWDYGLEGACRSGDMKNVELTIQKGANDWDNGLQGACLGGHMEIVNLMIQKGACNWAWIIMRLFIYILCR